jgi:hypothetical protein
MTLAVSESPMAVLLRPWLSVSRDFLELIVCMPQFTPDTPRDGPDVGAGPEFEPGTSGL